MQRKPLRKHIPKTPNDPYRQTPCCMAQQPLKTIKKSNKQNSQKAFFMQNQCQILKLKGKDIEVSLHGLKQQLLELEDNKKVLERECLAIQKQIQNLEDGNIPQLKASILKLQMVQKNKSLQIQEWESKIMTLKKTIQEQSFNCQEQMLKSNSIEAQRWRVNSENEGMKKVKCKLEGEIDQLNHQRAKLNFDSIQYEPQQQKMNQNIQGVLKQVNQTKQYRKQKLGEMISKSLIKILTRIYGRILNETFQTCIVNVDDRRLKKKTLYNVMCIHQKYIDRIKQKYLQRFKRLISNTEQQSRLVGSIRLLYNNRQKCKILSSWKKEFMKVQYSQLRKQQTLSSMVEIMKSIQGSLVYAGFNILKCWNMRIKEGGYKIKRIIRLFKTKRIRKAFSSILMFSKALQLQQNEDQHTYAKSSLNIQRKYFKVWAHYLQSVKITSTTIKFKTFNILKQNRKEAKRNKYLEMIHLIIKKNNMTKLLMKSFYGLQMSTNMKLIEESSAKGEQIQSLIQRQHTLNLKQINKQKIKCREIGIGRLSTFMRSAIQQSFQRLKSNYLICLKLSSFEQSLKRMIQTHHLCRSFRSLVLLSSVSNYSSIKVQIDSHTQSIKRSIQQMGNLKQEEKSINGECFRAGKQYIINSLEGIYKKSMANTLLRIQNFGINRSKILIGTKRVSLIAKKLLIKNIFLDLKQFSMNKTQYWSYQMKISTFLKKKAKIVKKILFNELQKQSRRNQILRRNIQHIFKTIKKNFLQFALQNISTCSIYQSNLRLKLKSDQLATSLNSLQCQGRIKKEEIQNKTSELRSRISKANGYQVRHSINSLTRIIRHPASSALRLWHKVLKKQNSISTFIERMIAIIKKIETKKYFQKLLINVQKSISNEEISKYLKIASQFDANSKKAQFYSEQLQKEIAILKQESLAKEDQSTHYSKLLTNFEKIKLFQFYENWNKKLTRNILKQWMAQSALFSLKLSNFVNILLINSCKQPYQLIFQKARYAKKVDTFKEKIIKHAYKIEKVSIRNCLKYWKEWKNQCKTFLLKKQIASQKDTQNKIQQRVLRLEEKFQHQVIYFFNDHSKKKFFKRINRIVQYKKRINDLRQSTKVKYQNIISSRAFQRIFSSYTQSINKHKCASTIKSKGQSNLLKLSFTGWNKTHLKLKNFEKLFLRQYISSNIKSYQFDFFRRTKLCAQANKIRKLQKSSSTINRLVTFYENSSMMSLQKGFLKWRNNMKTIGTRKQFLKRLFKKAHTNKVFHAWSVWRMEANARHVQYYHQTQGEIRTKQLEYQRIRRYINQFKEKKGLLVLSEGQFVSSPRYELKQESEYVCHNNKKYQLLSKLVLLQNEQIDKIQVWNSLKYVSQLSIQMRKKSLFVHNMMRNTEKYLGFKKWRKQIQQSKQRLQNLDKNQLIDEINCIQQKVDVLHSSKHQLKQQMITEVKRTQLIHKFISAKQVLSKILIFRAGKRLQKQAISKWHSVYQSIAAKESQTIQLMAMRRIQELNQELLSLEYSLSLSLNTNEDLKITAMEGIEIAETLKYLTNERDELNEQIKEQSLTCEALSEENVVLQERFNLAQKQAYQLLTLARN